MSPEQHAKTLSIAHLLYATAIAIMSGILGWFLSGGSSRVNALPAFVLVLAAFAFMGPFLLTAYGVLHDRPWAKAIALVSVILSILSFPLGTTLAVYTLWYFFSDKGRKLSP